MPFTIMLSRMPSSVASPVIATMGFRWIMADVTSTSRKAIPSGIQVFEGTIIARKHGGIGETITVRRISYGVGCEKVFPLHSPNVAMIETVRKGQVRRAKLYYLRDRVGKAAKIKEKV